MPREFRSYEPDQGLLLPPSLRDWLPEGHLAFFISDAIDAMELSAFEARYGTEGPGKQAFDPRMMVKVLVYAYATGTFSSRKIAAKLHEDVAFRLLAADNFPAHRTLAEFRQRHLPEFRDLFVQVVQTAGEVGLVRLGTVAVDGSKVRASASKHKAMSYGRMKEEEKRLGAEIGELMARAHRTDAREDQEHGRQRRGDELPVELARREVRLEKIQQARRRLEARQAQADREAGREPGDEDRKGKPGKPFRRRFGEPEEKAQENFTDPDSRIMKRGSSGFEQCYNAQIAVDQTERIIVATAVTQSASDVDQLMPLLDQVKKNTGHDVMRCLADAGYRAESNLKALEARKIDGYVAMGREKEGSPTPLASALAATRRMARKLRTKRGREIYRKRKWIAEPPFSWIKSAMGFDRFHLRGLTQVTSEWDLACLAANLRRMHGKVVWV